MAAPRNVVTSGDAGAGDESQSAEFSLSAKDDEGFDLPEREEIRQKRKLTPGTKVFVIGFRDARVDSDGKEVIVMGINGPVKVEAADTDMAEVLVVRSARNREDLQRQKVEISDNKGLYIQVGINGRRAPSTKFANDWREWGSDHPRPRPRPRLILRPKFAGEWF